MGCCNSRKQGSVPSGTVQAEISAAAETLKTTIVKDGEDGSLDLEVEGASERASSKSSQVKFGESPPCLVCRGKLKCSHRSF